MGLATLSFAQQATIESGAARLGYWLQTQPAGQATQPWGLWVLLLIVGIVMLWWLLQGEAQARSPRSNVVVVTRPAAPNAPVRVTVTPAMPQNGADELKK